MATVSLAPAVRVPPAARGSGIVVASAASARPGKPTARKATRHPNHRSSAPPSRKPTAAPTGIAT